MIIEWLKNHVVELTEAIRQIVIVGVTFGLLNWTIEQQGIVIMAVSAVLALFTRSNTVTTNQLDQRVTERVVQREAGLPGPGDPAYPSYRDRVQDARREG